MFNNSQRAFKNMFAKKNKSNFNNIRSMKADKMMTNSTIRLEPTFAQNVQSKEFDNTGMTVIYNNLNRSSPDLEQSPDKNQIDYREILL